jgi:RNA polymerase sigma-70 factor (ECF subfamily)
MVYEGSGSPVTPDEVLQYDQLREVIAGTLEKLPGRCGEIFYLNRFEGLKYREIAERLSVSVKTVEANMGRALKEFRKVLATL